MNDSADYSLEEQQQLLIFARQTIEARLKSETPPDPTTLPGKFQEIRSCFVTLHTASGNLRGCIGSIQPYEPLAVNISNNAGNSAFRDPRFPSVSSLEELADLELEISVLTPPEPIDSVEGFTVGEHGIILAKDGRSAVFLPQVAPEQGWDRETTLNHLSMKAGLSPNAWEEPGAEFRIFRAIVFSENQ